MEDFLFKKLFVWQKAMELARLVYGIVKSFPAEERYALSDQLRRAVVSIPSNIAEVRLIAVGVEMKELSRSTFDFKTLIENGCVYEEFAHGTTRIRTSGRNALLLTDFTVSRDDAAT